MNNKQTKAIKRKKEYNKKRNIIRNNIAKIFSKGVYVQKGLHIVIKPVK